MLLFIYWTGVGDCKQEDVSIHLMLLFIMEIQAVHIIDVSFNTSHVTLYLDNSLKKERTALFQYISCYSLSYILWSHSFIPTRFQYISCYSLSPCGFSLLHFSRVSIHLMLLFIPRFIGFSSSNSFYNTAKYKGLQDFYQPTYHFLFTHQNLI